MRWLWALAVFLGLGLGRGYTVELVPYATTVLRFDGGVRYVATGWPFVQVQVLEGVMVLLRPLVREGGGELWVMLQDGRQYRFYLEVNGEAKVARTYVFVGRTWR